MATRTALIRFLALALAGSALGPNVCAMPLHRHSESVRLPVPVFRHEVQVLPSAQFPAFRPVWHDHFVGLTPEQRQQMREQMRQHWQQVPPEQRGTPPYQHRQNPGREGFQRMRDDRPPRDSQGHGHGDGPGKSGRGR